MYEEELIAAITQEAWILTPNPRATAFLKRRYLEGASTAAVLAPKIMPIAQWFAWLFERVTVDQILDNPPPVLLSKAQAQIQWEQVITQESAGSLLLRPQSMATVAMQAYDLLQGWEVDKSILVDSQQEDIQSFLRWLEIIEERLVSENWILSSMLPSYLIRYLESIHEICLPQIYLYGFNELPPVQQSFFDQLQESGVRTQTLKLPAVHESCQRTVAASFEDELTTAAHWAKEVALNDPTAQVAIVLPDIAQKYNVATTILDHVLMPEVESEFFQRETLAYNYAAGQQCREYGITEAIFQLLELFSEPLTLTQWRQLLLSPYIWPSTVDENAFNFLNVLATAPRELISLRSVIEIAKPNLPTLAHLLLETNKLKSRLPSSASFAKWLEKTQALLELWGWRQERPLDELERQVLSVITSVMQQLLSFDMISGPVDFSYYKKLLHRLMSETQFQPKSDPNAQIHCMGHLEAAGVQFTHMWLLGMDDTQWPPRSHPNPLLPISLQRDQQMPHASAARELAYAQGLQKDLILGSKQVILSYAGLQDGQTQTASTLITEFPEVDLSSLVTVTTPQTTDQQVWEWLEDTQGPAVGDRAVRGGTTVLAHQALCPFRAFAEHRLKAVPPVRYTLGLSPIDKGMLLHEILERFWSQYQDHEALCSISDLSQVLSDLFDRVILHLNLADHGDQLLSAEKSRVIDLLTRWLNYEKQREPFSIKALEAKQTVEIGGLTLKIRADRIDVLEDGSEVIIDYKTGKQAVSKWLGSQPSDPQLPLYAVSQSDLPAAVVFAQIRQDVLQFVGLSEAAETLPDVATAERLKAPFSQEWTTLIDNWSAVLTQLAQAYQAGEAAVAPKSVYESCTYCHLSGFCRVKR